MTNESVIEDEKKSSISDFPESDPNREALEMSNRLRAAVKRAGGNKAVAAKSGVPIATLNVYISGRPMKLAPAMALADACDVNLEWLAYGRGEMARGEATDALDDKELSEDARRELEQRTERLREAVRKGGGNTTVARRAGIPVPTLHTYLAGREIPLRVAAALASACPVSLDWLAYGNQRAEEGRTATQTRSMMFSTIDIELMAQAMAAAHATFATTLAAPEGPRFVQVMLLMYDDLVDAQNNVK